MITLTLASGTGVEGSSITLALAIASTGGDSCTQIQFTLSYSSDLTLTGVVTGAATTGASKTLSRAGNLVVIWGVNVNVIGDGTLSTLTFAIANPVSSGSLPVAITAIVASDADANPLGTTGVPGIVSIDIPAVSCPVGGDSAEKNVPYLAELGASGGTPPYTWSIIS